MINAAFRALADSTRREILRLLREGSRTSGDIVEAFPSAWPTISRHLSVLKEAGLITAERRGQHIVYDLNTSVVEDVIQHLLGWTKKGGGRRVP